MRRPFLRTGIVVLFTMLLNASSVVAQVTVEIPTSDFKGIDLDLDQNPLAPVFTNDADIFSRSTFAGDSENRVGAAISEHSLSGLNADGIFAADYRVQVDRKSQDPSGNREVAVGFYEANGVVDGSDISNPSVRNPDRIYPNFSYNSATQTGVDVNLDVSAELREAIHRGSSHIGATLQATFPQGTSSVSQANAPVIEITEYYNDPFDALPVFSGTTGLTYRGHADEFVTEGDSVVVAEEMATFQTFLRADESIDVLISETANPGNFYAISLASDDGDLLQPGDSFSAVREAFRPNGVAGFDFSARGRGLNELQAMFTINDIAYDGNSIERLDVSFWQNAYQSSNDSTPFGTSKAFGQLRINAVAVPEPGAMGLLFCFSTALAFRRRRR